MDPTEIREPEMPRNFVETLEPTIIPEDKETVLRVQCQECREVFDRHYSQIALPHGCLPSDVAPARLEAKLLEKDAKVPTRKRTTDAGYDLYSIEEVIVPARGRAKVQTGIAIACPPGYYYTIDGRSGLATKGIVPFRGTLDAGYTGQVLVTMLNFSDADYAIHEHDRIAQIEMHRIIHVDITVVEEFSEHYSTRGTAGFGSSGR